MRTGPQTTSTPCRAGLLALAIAVTVLLGAGAGRALAASRLSQKSAKLSPAAAQAAVNQSRALTAYQAMQRAYYNSTTGLYTGADAWPYSQAMAATISLAGLPGLHSRFQPDLIARLSGLQAYADHVDPQPAGYVAQMSHPVSDARFNDDNEWIGIELLRLYHLNHQQPLLSAASGLLDLVDSQWDGDPGTPCPGGLPWQSGNITRVRNTVTTAAGAELGAQLYLTTHDQDDLTWAVQIYNWTRNCLLNPDGLYAGQIGTQGKVTSTEWTYNQGTMIGAGVMLYQATDNGGYLNQAEATAVAALAEFGPQQLADQPVYFNAIYIRNLLLLGGVSGDPRYQRFAQWFADDAWANVRDPSSGLFHAGPAGATGLLDQAAMVQVYALLAEPISSYF